MKRLILCLPLVLAACASAREPVLASPPADGAKYRADLESCRAYQKKVQGFVHVPDSMIRVGPMWLAN